MNSQPSFARFALPISMLVVIAICFRNHATAQDAESGVETSDAVVEVYPAAVLPFQQRGRDVSERATQVTDLLFAELVTRPELYLVERAELNKILDEQQLSLAGMIDPKSANRVGHLTGAKVLVTGSVMEVNDKLYLVAKIIGTETSRVLGTSVKGNVDGDLGDLVEQLGIKVAKTISDRASEIVAATVSRDDTVTALKKLVGKRAKRPSVFISVTERHVGQATIDPAAQTELMLIFRELGFDVIDPVAGQRSDAKVLILGEGLSEFASRIGDFQSVKARLEIKAIDQSTGKVLAADRHVAMAVDLTEQIAGKSALQEAAAEIAMRVLPSLVKTKKGRDE